MLKGFNDDIAGLDLPDEMKATLIEAANKRAEGLLTKNTELLGKVTKLSAVQTQDQSSAEKLAVLEANIAQNELAAKGQYDDALKLKETGFSKTVDELSSKIEAFEAKDREQTIDLAIANQLKEVRINPLHQDAVTGYFKGKTTLVDGKAMVNEQSLSDAISEWSDSDSGKASRLAPDNTGGNANGGAQTQGSGNNMTDTEKRAADINKRFGKV